MEINITRTQATQLFERIRTIVAGGNDQTAEQIRLLLAAQPYEFSKGNIPAIPNFEPCGGEAHSNPFIDNCMRCAPRWGWVGPSVRIR